MRPHRWLDLDDLPREHAARAGKLAQTLNLCRSGRQEHTWAQVLVETAYQFPLERRLVVFAEVLAELYMSALRLPDLQPTGRDLPDSSRRVPGWAGLGPYEGYWEVYDPYELEEPVHTVLTDDLLDIYRDLTPGLAVIQSGTPGDVADALRTLHRAMQDTGVYSLNSPQTPKPGQEE